MQETVIKLGVVEIALSARARWPVVGGGPVPDTAVCQSCGGWAYVYVDDGDQYTVAGFRFYLDALEAAMMDEDSMLCRGAR
jgi:hypothetical protein